MIVSLHALLITCNNVRNLKINKCIYDFWCIISNKNCDIIRCLLWKPSLQCIYLWQWNLSIRSFKVSKMLSVMMANIKEHFCVNSEQPTKGISQAKFLKVCSGHFVQIIVFKCPTQITIWKQKKCVPFLVIYLYICIKNLLDMF